MSFLERLKHIVYSLIMARVQYYDGELHRFVFNGEQGSGEWIVQKIESSDISATSNSPEPRILIVAPTHFYEQDILAPTKSWLEARNIAKNAQVDAPFTGLTQFFLVRSDDNLVINYSVLKISESILKSSYWFITPLSWWVFKQLTPSISISINNKVFNVKNDSGTIRSKFVENRSINRLLENQHSDTSKNTVTSSTACLSKPFFGSIFSLLASTQITKSSRRELNWKSINFTLGLICGLYLLGSSLFLNLQTQYLEYRLESLTANTQIAMELRDEYNRLQTGINKDVARLNSYPLDVNAWPGILNLLDNGATLNSVSYQRGKVSVRGVAPRASDLLIELQSTPDIFDAQFTQRITDVRSSTLQNFGLSWVTVPPTGDNSE